ncbi:MAG: hypothetical protein GWP08_13655 [Nitrospiraceae bacterium]|nr:hypothetical protein [Nitrospiraceae bacterium]
MRRLWIAVTCATLAMAGPVRAQLSDEDIAALRAQGEAEGWTFTVGRTPATKIPLEDLCGLVEPKGWRDEAVFEIFAEKAALPPAFNWRDTVGCPPIRNQGGCGSCWAFSTVGAFECNIFVQDGIAVDLSEQWLVSCNQETAPPTLPIDNLEPRWGCNGGWFAHDYHTGAKTDSCGGSGAVLEADFPYTETDAPCACPYAHPYMLDSWAFIGPEFDLPSVDAIKQAIYEYGPVSTAIYASGVYSAYTGGVFNADSAEPPNHGVVILGWNDALGANGAWLTRNSWGSWWGEAGYMWIEYGVSSVGYGANFVVYSGAGSGTPPTITRQPAGAIVEQGKALLLEVQATGVGAMHYTWERDGAPVGGDAPTLSIPAVTPEDAGSYRCHVSDIRGAVMSSSAVVTVVEAGALPLGTAVGVLVAGALAGLGARHLARHRRASKYPPERGL